MNLKTTKPQTALASGRGTSEENLKANYKTDYNTRKIEFNEISPNSDDAEIGALSACVADTQKIEPVRAIVGPNGFYMGGATAIFQRMLKLHSEYPDLTGVPFLVRLESSFDHHPDYSKFRDLFDSLRPLTGATALHFAHIVREMADRRKLIRLTYEANQMAFDPAFDLANIIAELREPLDNLWGGVL
jgi:replicative DNA helicase